MYTESSKKNNKNKNQKKNRNNIYNENKKNIKNESKNTNKNKNKLIELKHPVSKIRQRCTWDKLVVNNIFCLTNTNSNRKEQH